MKKKKIRPLNAHDETIEGIAFRFRYFRVIVSKPCWGYMVRGVCFRLGFKDLGVARNAARRAIAEIKTRIPFQKKKS